MSDRRVDLGIWEKLNKALFCLVILAGLVGVAVWYLPLIKQNERMRQEILRLDSEITAEEAAARRDKATIDALRNDPKTVERFAREKLSLAQPDETVIRFEEPDPNGP